MKKIAKIMMAILMVITLTACAAKSYELNDSNYSEYLKIDTDGVYSAYSLYKNASKLYVSRAYDDREDYYCYGYVYDKLEIPFEVKGASGYSYENAEVTITVKATIGNIYQGHVDQGRSCSKAKKKNVTETVTIKLDEHGKGKGTIVIKCWGGLTEENGISGFEIKDIDWTVKGTVTESKN